MAPRLGRQTLALTEPLLKGPAEQCCSFSFQLHTHTHARARRLLCDGTGSWRSRSAVIKAACKRSQASRRQIDFSISDWPSAAAPRAWLRGPVRGGGGLIFHPERPYFCGWNSRQLGCSSVSLVRGHAPARSAGLMFTVANANAPLRLLSLAPETFT